MDDALSLNRQLGIKEEIKEAYNSLAELDSLEGNFKSAYENHKMYILYRDSLVNKENAEKIVGLQMQYEFDKKEAATKLEQEQKWEKQSGAKTFNRAQKQPGHDDLCHSHYQFIIHHTVHTPEEFEKKSS